MRENRSHGSPRKMATPWQKSEPAVKGEKMDPGKRQRIRAFGPPILLWIADLPGFEKWAATQNELSLSRPGLLLSAGRPERLDAFARRNPWATSTELLTFHAGFEEPPAVGFRRFMPPGLEPWAVLGVKKEWDIPYTDEIGGERFDVLVKTARAIVEKNPPMINVWEIEATRTPGLLAVGAALANGKAVAVASSPGEGAHPLTLAACRKHGVVLRVVQNIPNDTSIFSAGGLPGGDGWKS